MREGHFGMIASPRSGDRPEPGVRWCADNGAFTGKYKGDEIYLDWLASRVDPGLCEFAIAPDMVCDPVATWEKSKTVLPQIRDLGLPAALAAQNGLEDMIVPWGEFDVLFLGGDTQWKLGEAAARLTAEANDRGKSVHMGRVNSLSRMRRARQMGCSTMDGTFLAYGPEKNLPQLLYWLDLINRPAGDPREQYETRKASLRSSLDALARWQMPPDPSRTVRVRCEDDLIFQLRSALKTAREVKDLAEELEGFDRVLPSGQVWPDGIKR